MTKEKLQAKLEEYQAQKELAIANANALNGAIQDVQYWLSQFEERKEETEDSGQLRKPDGPFPSSLN